MPTLPHQSHRDMLEFACDVPSPNPQAAKGRRLSLLRSLSQSPGFYVHCGRVGDHGPTGGHIGGELILLRIWFQLLTQPRLLSQLHRGCRRPKCPSYLRSFLSSTSLRRSSKRSSRTRRCMPHFDMWRGWLYRSSTSTTRLLITVMSIGFPSVCSSLLTHS